MLVAQGFFPTSPKRPNVAFDIHVLEFVISGFHGISPQERSWADALERHLRCRNFSFGRGDETTEVSFQAPLQCIGLICLQTPFRRYLTNALHWFETLVERVNAAIDIWTERIPASLSVLSGGPSSIATTDWPCDDLFTGAHHVFQQQLPAVPGNITINWNLPVADLPSRYLQQCCPACFGGSALTLHLSRCEPPNQSQT